MGCNQHSLHARRHVFCAFEAVIHIGIGIRSLRTFGPYGMNTLYSPGLVTSLFGCLPIAGMLAAALLKAKPRPLRMIAPSHTDEAKTGILTD